MKTIHAVFEGGVFRPIEPVDLPEHCQVQFDPVPIPEAKAARPVPDHSRFRGILKNSPIDPLEYQRRMREEWG